MTSAPNFADWIAWLSPLAVALAVPAGVAWGLAAVRRDRHSRPSRSCRRHRAVARVAILASAIVVLAELTGLGSGLRGALPRSAFPVGIVGSEPTPALLPGSSAVAFLESGTDAEVSPVGGAGSAVADAAPSPVFSPEDASPVDAGAAERDVGSRGRGRRGGSWMPAWIWLAGLAFFVVRSIVTRVRFSRFIARRGRPAGASLTRRVARLGERLSLRPRELPRVVLGGSAPSPVVFGFLRPVLVVPADFESRFTAAQQDAVLAHELGHVALGDLRFRVLSDWVAWVAWWHPGPRWLRRAYRDTSEACADEAAATLDRGPRHLAESLVALGNDWIRAGRAWRSGGTPSWMHAARGRYRSRLGRRVDRLLSGGLPAWRRPAGVAAVLSTLGGVAIAFALVGASVAGAVIVESPEVPPPIVPPPAAGEPVPASRHEPSTRPGKARRFEEGDRSMKLISKLRGSLLGASLLSLASQGAGAETSVADPPTADPGTAGASAEAARAADPALAPPSVSVPVRTPSAKRADAGSSKTVEVTVRCATVASPRERPMLLGGEVRLVSGDDHWMAVVRDPTPETLAWARSTGTSEGYRSLPVESGRRARVAFGKKTAYVEKFEVTLGAEAVIADPVIGSLETGYGLDVTPTVVAEGIDLALRLEHDDLVSLDDRVFELPTSKSSVTIQVPRVEHRAGAIRDTVESGETLLWLVFPESVNSAKPSVALEGSRMIIDVKPEAARATLVEIRATVREPIGSRPAAPARPRGSH